ncbi:uncharacterized protein M6B38_284820 [Iris pallida]|uniref:Uncharacterized protein n=1 Tax=Iris pallida TaxID=29817 RepID=A0AAX6I2R7_IRIPA|nr:uncharacterized protein M6B38_284820 [Iris pallida]
MLSSSSSTIHAPPPPITTVSQRKLACSKKKKRATTSITCKRAPPKWLPPSTSVPLPPLSAFPLAASISILLWSTPAYAGFLSGSTGLESVPGPQLPQFDFLNKWNDTNQKRYAELDSKFKSSTVLKDLLEKSKLNKERNRQEIQDKYCLRGAEWGVGDCSTQGMTDEEKDSFIAMLKKRVGE